MALSKRVTAEFFGTFWLVFGGCGSAVLAAAFPNLGIGFLGVALAFGLTVLTMAYAIGHISGCHLNPAVSAGLCVGSASQHLSWVHISLPRCLAAAQERESFISSQVVRPALHPLPLAWVLHSYILLLFP